MPWPIQMEMRMIKRPKRPKRRRREFIYGINAKKTKKLKIEMFWRLRRCALFLVLGVWRRGAE
jgi:hypothetical protein